MTSGSRGRALFLRLAPWTAFRNTHPHDLIWPVSMLHAEALAREAGWWTRILDLHVEAQDEAATRRQVEACEPDLLLLDTMTPTMAEARDLAARLRRRWPHLRIWGIGQHASEQPEDLLYPDSPFDGCLLGEYEDALPELLESGGLAPQHGAAMLDPNGSVQRLGGIRQVDDPDALPPVDPTGLSVQRYVMRSVHVPSIRRQRWGYLLTSRGCPFRCIFCSPTLRQSFGRRYRAQAPERVVDDMARLDRDHGVTAVYMVDDLFTYDRERVLAICEVVRRKDLRLRWAIQTRADCLDREMLEALASAGCCAIKLGVESGVDRVLEVLCKDLTVERIRQTASEIAAAGLSLTACYMLGNPTESLSEMAETFRFARELAADMIQVSFHTPYPGSESYRRHRSHVLDPSLLSHYEQPSVNLSQVDGALLEREQRRFYRRYYTSPGVLLNYLRRRAPYRLRDLDEWRLLLRALRYLFLPPGRQAPAASAAGPIAPRQRSSGQPPGGARVVPIDRARSGHGRRR